MFSFSFIRYLYQTQYIFCLICVYNNNLRKSMNKQIFSSAQNRDALVKMTIYLNQLDNKMPKDKLEKIVMLATQTFMKFMDNEDFSREAFEKTKDFVMQKGNYFGLLLVDQMLKTNKLIYKMAKRQIDKLFREVWQYIWKEGDTQKLQILKTMMRVWGHIYSDKIEQNLKKWIQSTYKIKVIVNAEHESLIKNIYGVAEKQKKISKMDQLLINMQIQQRPTKASTTNHNLLLQSLGFDED